MRASVNDENKLTSDHREKCPHMLSVRLHNTLSNFTQQFSLVSLSLSSLLSPCISINIYNRFHCDVPDEFLFTDLASIAELVESIRMGGLTPEQKEQVDSGVKVAGPGDGTDGRSTTQQISRKEPLCPWFTCCY